MSDETSTPEPVRRLVEQLANPQPMRRGSLGQRWVKCGKANCACASNDQARHGPYFCLTRGMTKGTQSRRLSKRQAEIARQQLDAGKVFRQRIEAYWQACEQWADAELEEAVE